MSDDIHHVKLGAPRICPRCKAYNPSGVPLPEDCWYCGEEAKKFEEVLRKRFEGWGENKKDG